MKLPAKHRVDSVLRGIGRADHALEVLIEEHLIPEEVGHRYFCEDLSALTLRRAPSRPADLARWASMSKRKIQRIESLALEAMVRIGSWTIPDFTVPDAEHPAIVWSFSEPVAPCHAEAIALIKCWRESLGTVDDGLKLGSLRSEEQKAHTMYESLVARNVRFRDGRFACDIHNPIEPILEIQSMGVEVHRVGRTAVVMCLYC